MVVTAADGKDGSDDCECRIKNAEESAVCVGRRRAEARSGDVERMDVACFCSCGDSGREDPLKQLTGCLIKKSEVEDCCCGDGERRNCSPMMKDSEDELPDDEDESLR